MTTTQKRPMNPLTLVLILASIFFAIFLVISGLLYLGRGSSGSATKSSRAMLFGKGSVAVVELKGVIMDSRRMVRKLEALEENPEVKAVVIQVNSPGGAVAPSQEIYEAVKRIKKPVVVSMASVAASGGYYVACAAKKIFANPGTITGSIGVIMEFANLEKLYEWAKVQRFAIKTGKFKDVGASYRAMPPEERELLQGMVDDVLGQFKAAIVEGRKIPMAELNQIADGRIFSGAQAKKAKLVDELGTLNDAIAEAGKMAGIKGKPEVLYPGRAKHNRLLELLMDDNKDEDSENSQLGSGGVLGELAHLLLGDHRVNESGSLSGGAVVLPAGIYWLWQGSR